MSFLRTRNPGYAPSNLGTIDAVTYGRGVQDVLDIPEAGALGQPEVYTMTGQRWLANGFEQPANRFTATMTNLIAASFDVARMGLGTASTITGVVTTDGDTRLELNGHWASKPTVTITGAPGSFSAWSSSGLTLWLKAGKSITITVN